MFFKSFSSFVVCICAALSTTYCISQIPTNGLVGAWTFNGNANDVSGNNNNGTVYNATLTTDRCGNPNSAYYFNGSNSYILMLATGPTGTVSRSVSFWAQTSYTGTAPKCVFGYGGTNGSGVAFAIQYNYNCNGIGVDVNNQALTRGGPCMVNNVWHHIVAIVNSTVGTQIGQMQFYVDGALLPSINCVVSGSTQLINTGSTFPVTIGKVHDANARYFNGSVDDVYLYNRALSSTEVSQLYNASPCLYPVTGNTVVCPGSSYVYTVPVISNSTYTWSLPSGWTGTSSANTITVTAGTGTGVVSVVASATACGTFSFTPLTVTSIPSQVTVASSSYSTCPGVTAIITPSGGTSYTISPPGGTVGIFSSTYAVSPNVTTTYTITGINSASCLATTHYTQHVVTNTTIAVASPVNIPCNGGTGTITATGLLSYTWMPGNMVFSSQQVSPTVTTIYTVTGMTPYGCNATGTVMVQVPLANSLAVSPSSPTSCVNGNVVLSALHSGGSPGYTYTWTGGPASPAFSTTSGAGGNVIYTVTSTDANNCQVTATASVLYYNNPTVTVASVSVCPLQAGILTPSGAVTYTWLPSGLTGATFTDNPATSTGYTVVGMTATGCTAATTATISIKPAPVLSYQTYSITCASLGSATVSASGGIGPYSFTWTPTGQTTAIGAGMIPGVYTVAVNDNGTGCTYYLTTYFAPLVPLTGNLSNAASITCNGAATGTAAVLNLAGGSGNQSYLWSNGSTSYTSPSPASLTAGTWSITVTDALTGCQVNDVFFIAQPPAITINVSSQSPTVCAGFTHSLSALATGGTGTFSYQWTNGPASNTHTVTQSNSGTFLYTVTATDANSCIASNTILVGFVTNPVITTSNASICPLQTGTVSASGAASYTWNSASSGSTMTDSPSSTAVYTVEGEALGCTSFATATITVLPAPYPFINSNSPRCEQTSLSLYSGGGINYAWSGPQSFFSSLQSPSLGAVQFGNAGVYNLTVTAANGCTASASTTVVVNNIPTVTVSGSTVCTTQTLNLAGFSAGAGTFSWKGPLGFTSSVQSPSVIHPPLNTSGNYTLTVTSPQGCTNSAVANATVVPPPLLATSLSSQSLCAQALSGSSNTVFLNASGAVSYSLFIPASITSTAQNGTNPSWPLVTAPPYVSTIVVSTATLLGSNGICTSSTTASFSIIPNPTIGISSASPVICAGQTFTYTSHGAQSYTWSSATPNYTSYSNGGVAVTNPSINSVFSVVGTSLGCNSALMTSSITVNPLPNVSVIPSQTNICKNSTAHLIASGNSESYTWSPPNGLNTTVGDAVDAKPGSDIQYVVTGTAKGCTALAVANISLLELPSPSIALSSHSVCINEFVIFSGFGGKEYFWQGPNSISFAGKTVTVNPSSQIYAGVYSLTVVDAHGCAASTVTSLSIKELPVASLTGIKPGCAPLCSDFALWSTSSKIAPKWTVEGKIIEADKFSYCFKDPGDHIIKGYYYDLLTGCSVTHTYVVSVLSVPKADFYWLPEHPVEGVEDVKFVNATDGKEQISWIWSFAPTDSATSTEFRTDDENPRYFYSDAGTYPVALVVTNSGGCIDTVVKYVTIEADFTCYIPNAFTPNTDDKNDVFLPVVRGAHRYSLAVFNRWGEMIFSTTDPQKGWDGTYREKRCSEGAYAYRISIVTVRGDPKEFSGHILLYR